MELIESKVKKNRNSVIVTLSNINLKENIVVLTEKNYEKKENLKVLVQKLTINDIILRNV